MASPPLVVVLTGGSGVGKTTLIDRLASFGFSTVPEAAMQVIDSLNTLLDDGSGGGPEQQLAWRSTHKTAFGNLVGTVALQQEQRALRSSSNVLFLDRSVLDNLGYARVRGYDPPAFLTEELVQSVVERITHVFVLEPPASNHAALEARNAETGRATDPAGSKHVSSVMHDVYASLGCRTHWLADAPVNARLEVILDACGLAKPDEPACSDIHRALSTHLLGRATCDAYETGGDARPADAVAAPHTNLPSALLEAIFARLRPAFLVEVGSWKGGSALRIADAAVAARARGEAPPCLLCIDTWLGDGGAWIERNPGWRDGLLLDRGLPQLFRQFCENTRRRRNVIFPWPLSSLSALRALQHLVVDGHVPSPEFVYLDSAHEAGETLLEITRAFDLLPDGGVLVGDDLDWPAVERDLRRFCSERAAALVPAADDDVLGAVPHLYHVADDAFWTYDSSPRQWALRKRGGGTVDALRRAVDADEVGADCVQYVPLTDADREGVRLYREAIAMVEAGRGDAARPLFRKAAAASRSVAYHFKL